MTGGTFIYCKGRYTLASHVGGPWWRCGVLRPVGQAGDDVSATETRREALLAELSLHLSWASRTHPASPSRKHLRKMFSQPEVLDLIEELVNNAGAR